MLAFPAIALRRNACKPIRAFLTLLGISFLTATAPFAFAQSGPDESDAANKGPAPGEDEPIGTWAFTDAGRPVKLVVVGGSVAAYFGGNFGDFIQASCPAVEVRNIARAKYGAWAMFKRLQAQVFKNRKLKPASAPGNWWVAVNGGLNSVATPEKTNEWIRRIFEAAHSEGYRVLGFSLTPWGDASDKRRWTGASALHYKRATQKAVDYVMNRLEPDVALGAYGKDREPGAFRLEERADIAVDLYDSDLRAKDAAPYDIGQSLKAVKSDSRLGKELKALPQEEQDAALQRLAQEAASVPQWFMRRELHSFDHIHPNQDGHRLIALAACPKLPADWKCDCQRMATLNLKDQR